MRLHLEELIDLLDVLVAAQAVVEHCSDEVMVADRIETWVHRVEAGVAAAQKSILMAVVYGYPDPSGPDTGPEADPLPAGGAA